MVLGYHPSTCSVHTFYASTPRMPRIRTGRPHRLDAHEIKTAVAHQAAAREAAETPFVNLFDPARQLGPDGRPAVSRRAPIYEDVPDAQWNDWRWQLATASTTSRRSGRS